MRILTLIKKEFIQLSRDKRLLFLATMGVVLQLTVFGYVASFDIKHISAGVLDFDRSQTSRQFISRLENTGYFKCLYLSNFAEGRKLIQNNRIKLIIYLPPDFSKNIFRHRPAPVQAIFDGTDANTASIALGYLKGFIFKEAQELREIIHLPAGVSAVPELELRVWYNPELKSVNYMVPGTIAFVLTLIAIILTSTAIVREKESGTIDQLMVTPIESWELLLGKILPFTLVSFIDVLLVIAVGVFWFRVPLLGNIFLLLGAALLFLISSLGIGLFISVYSANQQQVFLTTLSVVMPSMILSGFIFPVESMPPFLQGISSLIPMRYFLQIVRGIFLKGSGFVDIWGQLWPLGVIGSVIFILSVIKLRRDLG